MAQDESVQVWIVSVESESADHSEPHYFYRLGAGNHDLVRNYRLEFPMRLTARSTTTASCVWGYCNPEGGAATIGLLAVRLTTTICKAQTVKQRLMTCWVSQLQHSTRITWQSTAVVGERWDLRLP